LVTYNVATPAEYLKVIDQDWRRDKLLELRALITQLAPSWQEVVSYKMLGYGEPGNPVLHLNAQKGYVGLYVGDVARVDPDGSLLGGIDYGKSCVRFRKKNRVTDPGVKAFLKRYVAMKARGEEFEC